MKKELKVIDLFAGAGGMSEGFSQAGFHIIAANEILTDAAATFKFNHKNVKMIMGDIEKITPTEFMKKSNINKEDIDIIIGGPPCQGFSMANRQKLSDDPRNHLYKHFIKFVKKIQPKLFIMENVKGMLRKSKDVIDDFDRIGYYTDFRILNTRHFGIPQHRERIFFIGSNILNKEKIIKKIFEVLESKKSSKEIPLKDALWGLRKLQALPNKNMTNFEGENFGFFKDKIINNGSAPPEYILKINKGHAPSIVYNHKSRFNNKRDVEIFKRLPQGGKSDHPSISDIMPYKNRSHIFKDKYYKLKEGSVSKTITAHMKYDCHMYIHPWQSRGLTPREAARIQGFPDKYRFIGAFTSWYMMIGNAVPPPLAKIIALSIMDSIKKGAKNGN